MAPTSPKRGQAVVPSPISMSGEVTGDLQRSDTMDRRAMMLGVSKWDLDRFRRLFNIADADGSGQIDREEMRALLCEELGWDVRQDELDSLLAEVTSDEVDLDGFMQMMVLVSNRAEQSGKATHKKTRAHIRRSMAAPRGFVVADGGWRQGLDVVKLAALFYYGIIIGLWDIGLYQPSDWVSIGVTVLLFAHISVTMRTGISVGGRWLAAAEVLHEYLRSGMLLCDLIGAIPFDVIVRAFGAPYEVETPLRHLRLVPLLTVHRLFPHSERGVMSAEYVMWRWRCVPAITTTFWLTLFIHALSCIWVSIKGTDYEYIRALYFVLYTTTTVGYGDEDVSGDGARLYACALFLIGVVGQSVIMGYITAAVMQSNVDGDVRDRMLTTSAVLRHFGVPRAVQEEVLGFQFHSLKNHVSAGYADVVAQLPEAMQEQVSLFIRIRFIKCVPMFGQADTQTRVALAQSLRNEVFPPDTHVIIAGEEGDEMFFLAHGFCDVLSSDGEHLATIRHGGCFGEVSLLASTRRTASVVTLTFCDCFVLSLDDFYTICDAYPGFAGMIRTEILKRQSSQEFERSLRKADSYVSDMCAGTEGTEHTTAASPDLARVSPSNRTRNTQSTSPCGSPALPAIRRVSTGDMATTQNAESVTQSARLSSQAPPDYLLEEPRQLVAPVSPAPSYLAEQPERRRSARKYPNGNNVALQALSAAETLADTSTSLGLHGVVRLRRALKKEKELSMNRSGTGSPASRRLSPARFPNAMSAETLVLPGPKHLPNQLSMESISMPGVVDSGSPRSSHRGSDSRTSISASAGRRSPRTSIAMPSPAEPTLRRHSRAASLRLVGGGLRPNHRRASAAVLHRNMSMRRGSHRRTSIGSGTGSPFQLWPSDAASPGVDSAALERLVQRAVENAITSELSSVVSSVIEEEVGPRLDSIQNSLKKVEDRQLAPFSQEQLDAIGTSVTKVSDLRRTLGLELQKEFRSFSRESLGLQLPDTGDLAAARANTSKGRLKSVCVQTPSKLPNRASLSAFADVDCKSDDAEAQAPSPTCATPPGEEVKTSTHTIPRERSGARVRSGSLHGRSPRFAGQPAVLGAEDDRRQKGQDRNSRVKLRDVSRFAAMAD
eukprot:TRINITY_DN6753_c0_g1_i2.p1 TRINITY_DN6753_c0_g1~~TRINITY_DN6753_c0_g1_i2.p1  ORF type:complete len:1113 (+),score=231.78 TRINITY_DN6753_c0_g1_i2:67-3405(+)